MSYLEREMLKVHELIISIVGIHSNVLKASARYRQASDGVFSEFRLSE